MASPKTRRILWIAIINLVVAFALLAVIELFCRHLEQVQIERHEPARLRQLPPKGPLELRVFAFGGSTVFGLPVPEVGFVAQMQYWLRRLYPDRNIQVYNFGSPGMDTAYALRQLTRRLDDQPDLVIVITGHNEFFGPHAGRIDRLRETLRVRFATMRILQLGADRITRSKKRNVMPCLVAPWDRESASFKSRMATFEEEMNLIVRRTSQRGVKLILGTLPSNMADWPPVYKGLSGRDKHYSERVSAIQELLAEGRYQEASDAVKVGFSLYGEDAMLHFLQGRILAAMGDYPEAQESFVKARDLDPVPYRATSQINSIIRKAASRVPGVYLVDLEKEYQQHAANGLIGFDLIVDNCHSTPLGESVTAQALIQKMTEIGLLPPSGEAQDACCPVRSFLADAGYLAPKSAVRFRGLLNDAKYVMKTPFLDFEASRMYLLEAMMVDENSWEVWANLATLSYFAGDNAAGATELRRAMELHRTPLDIDDRGATPYLKEALEYSAGRTTNCGYASAESM